MIIPLRLLVLVICPALLLSGCAGRSLIAPRNPLTDANATGIHRGLIDPNQIAQWRAAYEYNEGITLTDVGDDKGYGTSTTSGWRFTGTPSPDIARRYRNKIIRQLLVIDDDFFTLWSQKLYGTRVIGSTIADVAAGVLSAFGAAATGGSSQGLALGVSAITTTRLAAQKNVFLEQNAGALISTMEEDRSRVRAQITQYLRQSVDEYALEDGLADVLRYYKAGTLASASSSLQATAAGRERQASAVVEVIKGDEVVAPQDLKKADVVDFVSPPPRTVHKTKRRTVTGKESAAPTTAPSEAHQLIVRDIVKLIGSPEVDGADLLTIATDAGVPAPNPGLGATPSPAELASAKEQVADAISETPDTEEQKRKLKTARETARNAATPASDLPKKKP